MTRRNSMTRLVDISQDSDSSTVVDDTKSRIKTFARHMLKKQIFVGEFREKRFVESINAYRDVIKISENETKFIRNLKAVNEKILKENINTKVWVGITEPNTIGAPADYCIWVQLKQEIFGKYWFNVKGVEVKNNEITLKLDILREFSVEQEHSNVNEDLSTTLEESMTVLKEKLIAFIKGNLTVKNFRESITFITVTVITITALLIECAKWFSEYLLKFMHELSGIIRALTPIMQTTLKTITQIIIGLLFMIFGRRFEAPRIQKIPPKQYRPAIEYPAIEYPNTYYVTEPPY